MLRNSLFMGVVVLCAVFIFLEVGSVPVQSGMFVSGKYVDENITLREAIIVEPIKVKRGANL